MTGTILLVDSDEEVGCTVRKFLRRWTVEQVYCLTQAHERITSIHNLILAILDFDLPEAVSSCDFSEGAFGLAKRLRAERPNTPRIFFSARCSPNLINGAYIVDADYIVKENFALALSSLAERLACFERVGLWSLAPIAQNLRTAYGLSKREAEVAELLTAGLGPSHIAQRLGASRGTVKTYIERIHAKTGWRRCELSAAAGRIPRWLG